MFVVLSRAYSADTQLLNAGYDWDNLHLFITPDILAKMRSTRVRLTSNPREHTTPFRTATYEDFDCDVVYFTDASLGGWRAYVHKHPCEATNINGGACPHKTEESITAYRQMWVNELERTLQPRASTPIQGSSAPDSVDREHFMAQHSAHAEPRATELLRQLVAEGLPNENKGALETDHHTILHAQRQSNGFDGIGRA